MFAHKSFVLAWFLRILKQCLGQSINLVTTASDEDPKPKLIVRGKVGHSTVLMLCVLSIACTHF